MGSAKKTLASGAGRFGALSALALVAGLLFVAPASASFEQVATFADGSESQELLNAESMAVNTTGAGGVPAGTLYAVDYGGARVLRYGPKGELREQWGWGVADGKVEFERCGPDGEAAHPACHIEIEGFHGIQGEGVGQLSDPIAIAVDQVTGDVYVLNGHSVRKHKLIQVFSANGSQVITEFGEPGASSESIEEGPEKLHRLGLFSGMAVNGIGTVYVSDGFQPGAGQDESRVMTFRPETPGDYEHYIYADQGADIDVLHTVSKYLAGVLTLDDAGNLYTSNDEYIFEFAPGEPVNPVCEYQAPSGGIEGMTVNPQTGEIFYFTYKNKELHQLAACNGQGRFIEKSAFPTTPEAEHILALAFSPALAWEALRPAGVLYAADPKRREGNAGGRGFIFAPAESHLPSVDSESVSAITSTTAALGAQINPHGAVTRYAFQYETEAQYEASEPAERFAGAAEAPLGGALLGSGQKALAAATALVGLQPDTEYRYRAIATSHCNPDEEEVCEVPGPAQAFRTFPAEAPGLPDGRAWELVSPARKQGGEVIVADIHVSSCSECKPGANFRSFPRQSSPDGEAVVYEGFPFSHTEGAKLSNEYLSRRTASGWQTTILAPRLLESSLSGYEAFNADLTQGVLSQTTPSLTPEAPFEYPNLYTQPTSDPAALSPLVGVEPPSRLSATFNLRLAGASADFSRLFFEANDALTPETSFAPEAVDGGEGKYNLYELSEGELRLVNVAPGDTATAPGAAFGSGFQIPSGDGNIPAADYSQAISEDGSRVFFSDEAGQLYVRENGETTLEIPDSGRFLTASADGSRVLLSDGRLYDLETETTTDLTEGEGGFKGIVGQSEGLSHVYFIETAALSGEEENDQGDKAQAGEENLYSWHEGTLAFVATLLPVDTEFGKPVRGDATAAPVARTAEASPDGRWVAFLSGASLTGYDNEVEPDRVDQFKACPGAAVQNDLACVEAFLYDSTTGRLICASCDPSGARPIGSSTLRVILQAPGSQPQPRYLSDEGRLFFDSKDSLSPFDTNDGVEDVYQYEPDEVGSCKREGGCVSLISAGHEPVDSNFLAADETGKNVFFTTRDQLVQKDTDDLLDLYVAREGGGIPAETETARSECQGEACQPQVSAPNDPTPGSSSFEGAGNVVEEAKGKKHRKHRHKHRARKHHHARTAKHNRGGAR